MEYKYDLNKKRKKQQKKIQLNFRNEIGDVFVKNMSLNMKNYVSV